MCWHTPTQQSRSLVGTLQMKHSPRFFSLSLDISLSLCLPISSCRRERSGIPSSGAFPLLVTTHTERRTHLLLRGNTGSWWFPAFRPRARGREGIKAHPDTMSCFGYGTHQFPSVSPVRVLWSRLLNASRAPCVPSQSPDVMRHCQLFDGCDVTC